MFVQKISRFMLCFYNNSIIKLYFNRIYILISLCVQFPQAVVANSGTFVSILTSIFAIYRTYLRKLHFKFLVDKQYFLSVCPCRCRCCAVCKYVYVYMAEGNGREKHKESLLLLK